jgi:hypothetical protein
LYTYLRGAYYPDFYFQQFFTKIVAIVSNWQTMCAIVIQWQTIMMLRLKLNDLLVDIASEGLLRPKLYDEKETFDFQLWKIFENKNLQ